MIKAVLFDVDGVLIDSFEANFQYYKDLMPAAGHSAPTRSEYEAIAHLGAYDSIKALIGGEDKKEIERVETIGEKDVPYHIDRATMSTGATEVLKELHKNYKLGIVTNRRHPFEPPQFKEIKDYFDVAIGYNDTKHHKPHPEPLHKAMESLGVAPKETVYVGDSETDFEAARDAGVAFVYFSLKEHPEADVTTHNFAEIPLLIKELKEK